MHDTQTVFQQRWEGQVGGQNKSLAKELEEGIPGLTEETKQRFLSKLKKSPNGCWIWQFSTADGYGVFRLQNGTVRAHRVSWIIHFGPIPIGEGHHGTCVLHKCDNRKCCNPDHLFLGTQAENLKERDRKGRQSQGRKLSNAIKRGLRQKRHLQQTSN